MKELDLNTLDYEQLIKKVNVCNKRKKVMRENNVDHVFYFPIDQALVLMGYRISTLDEYHYLNEILHELTV